MNNFKNKIFLRIFIKKFLFVIISVLSFIAIFSCSKKFSPEPLSLKVKQNLALLQEDPQFVMYFNFKKMRDTKFWNEFLSDSVFAAERSFGGLLKLIQESAGVSISDGIDELYYSNSWIGDNAMVIKGTFDRKKIDEKISSDSLYTKIDYPGGVVVYKQQDANLNFYFKDDFTLCASNYLKIIENTFNVKDTSFTGLLTNQALMKEIELIKFKDNLWMISNQKLFIRGIFENFSDLGKQINPKAPGGEFNDSLNLNDTADVNDTEDLYSVYKKINSVAFSIKMTDEIEIVMQNQCEDIHSASELKNKTEAIIALAKLSSALSGKKPPAVIKLLDKVETNLYESILLIEAKLNQNDIKNIRMQSVF